MDNVELVMQGYQNFAEGKVEEVLAVFHPDIVWDESHGFPYIDGDGIYTGPMAVAQDVFAKLPEYYNNFQIEIKELFGSGDKVVMVGHYRGTWKATGKEYKANATHVWTVKEGLATDFFQAVDTAAIINP